jgi:ribosome-associated toxin RatA of RatAB toxin-antitoxin module
MWPRAIFKAVLHAFVLSGLFLNLQTAFAAEPADWQKLSQGEVVIKQHAAAAKSIPSVEARILIPKAPDRVWKVVSDPEKLMKEESKVRKVKVLSRTANKQNVEFTVLMTRLFPPFNYVLLQELSPPSLLTFHRVSGSFRDIDGAWRLTPVEDGTKTILSYTLKLDAGPLIPQALLMGAVKSDLPNMMRNAKSAIIKDPR